MLFWIFIAGIFIFNPWSFFRNYLERHNSNNNIFDLKFRRRSKLDNIAMRVIGFVIAILITIYFTKPYLYDLPKLITGNFSYATGYVTDTKIEGKDLNEYVYIDGKELKFIFSANVEEYSRYRIGYLPNTSRAIYGVKLDESTSKIEKKIGFPFAKTLFFICMIAALVVLGLFSSYLRFKLLILACLIYFPTTIYIYIKQGLNFENWFSISNQGLLFILAGIAMLLIMGIIYFIERCKKYETPLAFFVIQILSIFMVLILFDMH